LEAPSITYRHTLRAGDIGSLVYLHGTLYSQEYGLDHTFEGYVASAAGEFAKTFDPAKDYFAVAENGNRMLGMIAIVSVSAQEAQLRWFLVHPQLRGRGVGRKLIEDAIAFCRSCNYARVFLWTISELETAAHLYTSVGFRLIEQKTQRVWGALLTEEQYELLL
jgi:N-acetylglutamate synthase-like GNAT family acetyltransferase